MMDILPGELVGDDEKERMFYESINIGDRVMIIEHIRYDDRDDFKDGEAGIVTDLDPGDEWGYKVTFKSDQDCQWFKRWHLKKMMN
jgi:hypothetical protein